MVADAALFAVGLLLVTMGADWLVTGASRLAADFGMSPLVVGLTVVAFGTSAPELVVSGAAAIRSQPGLAVGNVMGSTVANVGLIVGLGALIRPIDVHRRLLARESPLLIFVLAIVMALSLNAALGRLDGLALVVGFVIYLRFLLRWGREEGRPVGGGGGQGEPGVEGPPVAAEMIPEERDPAEATGHPSTRPSWLDWLRTLIGLGGLLLGANWLLDSSVAIARAFHVSETVIGATMVAVGTSLPELASTVAAAARGLGDIAIGNVIGSNIFNLGLVLGTAALLNPLLLPPQAVVRLVLPALFFCVLLIPLAYTRGRVGRWEAALLLALYGVFLAWII
ncbi:MAG: calcium/sodium antiporter [Gemmatimonadota bacterium]